MGARVSVAQSQSECRRGRHVEVFRRRAAPGRPASGLVMKLHLLATISLCAALSVSAGAQNTTPKYTITVMPPGGPAPRLPDGHPDFTGHWLPNGAAQGVSGRFGVDPAAMRTFDPRVTPEETPAFQPWAAARIKAMTPTELELSKSSVNCLPRGVP